MNYIAISSTGKTARVKADGKTTEQIARSMYYGLGGTFKQCIIVPVTYERDKFGGQKLSSESTREVSGYQKFGSRWPELRSCVGQALRPQIV